MRERGGCRGCGCSRYTTKVLVSKVHFPKGQEICRLCPFCVADPSNHKREVCTITGEILPFAELKIDESCPLRDAGEEGD